MRNNPTINRDFVFQNFIQSCNSCTLTSYAVGAYAFVKIEPEAFFKAYCAHFKVPIPATSDGEHAYDEHFQKEWQSRKCEGYKIIQELHNTSDEDVFKECRKQFNVEFISDVKSDKKRIKQLLKKEKALISIAFTIPQLGVHSTVVSIDGRGSYMVETQPGSVKNGPLSISGLFNLGGGQTRDGLLMIKC